MNRVSYRIVRNCVIAIVLASPIMVSNFYASERRFPNQSVAGLELRFSYYAKKLQLNISINRIHPNDWRKLWQTWLDIYEINRGENLINHENEKIRYWAAQFASLTNSGITDRLISNPRCLMFLEDGYIVQYVQNVPKLVPNACWFNAAPVALPWVLAPADEVSRRAEEFKKMYSQQAAAYAAEEARLKAEEEKRRQEVEAARLKKEEEEKEKEAKEKAERAEKQQEEERRKREAEAARLEEEKKKQEEEKAAALKKAREEAEKKRQQEQEQQRQAAEAAARRRLEKKKEQQEVEARLKEEAEKRKQAESEKKRQEAEAEKLKIEGKKQEQRERAKKEQEEKRRREAEEKAKEEKKSRECAAYRQQQSETAAAQPQASVSGRKKEKQAKVQAKTKGRTGKNAPKKNPDVLWRTGQELLEQGSLNEAIMLFEQALPLNYRELETECEQLKIDEEAKTSVISKLQEHRNNLWVKALIIRINFAFKLQPDASLIQTFLADSAHRDNLPKEACESICFMRGYLLFDSEKSDAQLEEAVDIWGEILCSERQSYICNEIMAILGQLCSDMDKRTGSDFAFPIGGEVEKWVAKNYYLCALVWLNRHDTVKAAYFYMLAEQAFEFIYKQSNQDFLKGWPVMRRVQAAFPEASKTQKSDELENVLHGAVLSFVASCHLACGLVKDTKKVFKLNDKFWHLADAYLKTLEGKNALDQVSLLYRTICSAACAKSVVVGEEKSLDKKTCAQYLRTAVTFCPDDTGILFYLGVTLIEKQPSSQKDSIEGAKILEKLAKPLIEDLMLQRDQNRVRAVSKLAISYKAPFFKDAAGTRFKNHLYDETKAPFYEALQMRLKTQALAEQAKESKAQTTEPCPAASSTTT